MWSSSGKIVGLASDFWLGKIFVLDSERILTTLELKKRNQIEAGFKKLDQKILEFQPREFVYNWLTEEFYFIIEGNHRISIILPLKVQFKISSISDGSKMEIRSSSKNLSLAYDSLLSMCKIEPLWNLILCIDHAKSSLVYFDIVKNIHGSIKIESENLGDFNLDYEHEILILVDLSGNKLLGVRLDNRTVE